MAGHALSRAPRWSPEPPSSSSAISSRCRCSIRPGCNGWALITHKPATEDYVPLLPWLGVVMIGIALGHWLSLQQFRPLRPLIPGSAALAVWMGRHSLLVYMVHQPILIGLLRVLSD